MTLHHHIQHTLVFVRELILPERAEASTRLQHDVARALLEFATQDLHERRFAAAVGTDQAVAIAI